MVAKVGFVLIACVLLAFFPAEAYRRRYSALVSNADAAHETLRLCPRNLDNVDSGYRKCLRPCVTDADCKGRKKKCLCDGDCGMSCVKPHTKCAPLVDPANGKVHTTGIEAFGAKVFYTCQPEFKLRGPRARSCQGDGTWSGDAPLCQPDVKCDDPPEIPHAQHNADWRNRQYELDTMIQYTCESGYSIEGFARAKCIYFNGTAKWFGPDLRCLPRECGHPGDLLNGYREGDLLFYPHRVKFHCYPGYHLVGKPVRYCQRNGKWDGDVPICKAVECQRPVDPYNGKAIITSLKYEAVVTYECKAGYHVTRNSERRCLANQTWSGSEPKCEVVHCPQPEPVPNGGYNGTSTAYNSVVFYYCLKGMKFIGTHTSAKCLANGTWSHAAPQCFAPCVISHVEFGEISNGSPGEHISHGEVLNVSCNPKYELVYAPHPPRCDNGSLLSVPSCQAASCKMPPVNPRRGLVIAPKTEHAMKARFVCNKGYRIVGNDTVVCHYGNWLGEMPTCQEIYCPWPGKLPNGTVYLVGAMGSYEYYEYIKTVVQDRQIRYECSKGYFLHGGPAGATCVDGAWSPPDKPKCHPAPCSELKSPNFDSTNLVRDPEDNAHFIATVRCRPGYLPNTGGGRADCRNGVWSPRKPDCVPLNCRVPDVANGHYKLNDSLVSAWSELEDRAAINLQCIPGYQINGPERLVCSTGQLLPPEIPECAPASCVLTEVTNGHYTGGYRSGLQISHNSIVAFVCNDGFRKLPNVAVRCELGQLLPKSPECVTADHRSSSGCSSSELHSSLSQESFENGTTLEVPCENMQGSRLGNRTAICVDGHWLLNASSCSPIVERSEGYSSCELKHISDALIACHHQYCMDLSQDGIDSVGMKIPENAEVIFHCRHLGHYSLNGSRRLTCVGGKLDGAIPNCQNLMEAVDPLNSPPVISYEKVSGIMEVSELGELLVYPSSNVALDCLWRQPDPGEGPKWITSNELRSYPIGWASNGAGERRYRISLQQAVEEDTGIFTCVTPRGKAHSIVIKVQTVECPLLSSPLSKLVANTTSTRMGTVVGLSCPRGYSITGPNTLRCLPSGHWSAEIPSCLPILCPIINVTDSRLKVLMTSRFVGSIIEFECQHGFRMNGPAIAKCGADGEWSNDVPSCEENSCKSPATSENRLLVSGTRFLVGEEVELDCPVGYSVNGSGSITCLDSGQWSDGVNCVPSCAYPGHPGNGRLTGVTETKFYYDIGEEINFECLPGFSMNGESALRCVAAGRWSNRVPLCDVS